MIDVLRQCWFLAGPTASGKSDVALVLAERLNAEIVSLDSMAIYRGMDIGTAKPSAEARAAVPHHLIDIIDPHEEFSLAEYVAAAEVAARDIIARGKTPLFVGGTGLYLRGLLRGVFEGPAADWDLRRNLERELAGASAEAIHERLRQVDPQAARVLHPNDTRRVIRALEVQHLSGRPLSEQQRQSPLPPELRPQNVFWLHPPRAWLYERINARVESMFERGLIAEVERLLSLEKPLSRTARQALGYKETIVFLEARSEPPSLLGRGRGRVEASDATKNTQSPNLTAETIGDLASLIAQIQTRTRQFAKRQHTWFRNLEECRAVEIDGTEASHELAERLMIAGHDLNPNRATRNV